MIDAVLSFHTNTLTCGVARFSQQLAARLGVPFGSFTMKAQHPLVSTKFSEWIWSPPRPTHYDLFLHDAPATDHDWDWVRHAETVYAANGVIADAVRAQRPDVVTAWCPATVQGNASRGRYRVLVFGMSHKLLLPHFEQLKVLLEQSQPDYTVELSTAVHEGSPWDQALTESIASMRGIFGDHLRVLGFLGDDALAKELRDVDAVAMYFLPAARANNTSLWAALEAGKVVYTNLDAHSPVLDPARYSWDGLLQLFGAHVAV